ncbi:hypothetical protein [Robiginitalea aurantiaca]|uniref:hypothetical protein n=1 Tax=Robiginitalea aurantiaca TaxID=3056915 RepID=UPI0025A93A08|nr:hypothetical protein [Robiginitalea aurantiaca]
MEIMLGIVLYISLGMLWLKVIFRLDDILEVEEAEWCLTTKITTVVLWPILVVTFVKGFIENHYL